MIAKQLPHHRHQQAKIWVVNGCLIYTASKHDNDITPNGRQRPGNVTLMHGSITEHAARS